MSPDETIERVHRDSWAHLLGRLVAYSNRIDLAEDALADAFASAVGAWSDIAPGNPEGWLYTAAKRRIIDAIRRERTADREAYRLVEREPPEAPTTDDGIDHRLGLLWLAAHPALSPEVRPALALRFVLGVPTSRIAELFLVPLPTMAARLTRAKKRIASTGISFSLDEAGAWHDRADDVARTIMLAYTAGYFADPSPASPSSTDEAVELACLATDLVPSSASLAALAALVTLQHARRHARHAADGALITLAEQDRDRWVRTELTDGLRRFTRLEPTTGYAEQLRLMAAISAFHSVAPSYAHTDWDRIDNVYGTLHQLTDSPVVQLNRTAANLLAGRPVDPRTIDDVERALHGHHRIAIVRAEYLYSGGDRTGARAALVSALTTCPDGPEREHVIRRIDTLDRTDGRRLAIAPDPAGCKETERPDAY